MHADGMKEVVVSDGYRYAKSVMSHEWHWTPQRVKKAIILSRDVDISQVANLEMAMLYFASYPDDFDKIYDLLLDPKFIVGNPWRGSTIDPQVYNV